MARTERHKIQNREAVAEMPEWMKDKHCPHKKKYMSGKRIQPKNLTGKEKLTYLVDEVFLAYNSARLKEACQLFTNQMLAPDVTIGFSGSKGIPFLLQVIAARTSAFSETLPFRPFGRRSTSIR